MRENNLLLLVPDLTSGAQQRAAVKTETILRDVKNITIAILDGHHMEYDTDANVVNLNIPEADSIFGRLVNVFRRIRAVKRLKRELEIGCTMSFGVSANMVNVLSRQKDRVILSVHGIDSIPQKPMSKKMWHFLYQKADLVTCVSKRLKSELAKVCRLSENKVCTVYNPYDFSEIFNMSHEQAPFPINNPTVVSMGRLEDAKGFRHLIHAVKLASNRIPDLNLIIIGEGSIEEELRDEARRLGVKVTFAGFHKNPFAILAKCSCYVLSSIREGFPDALVESMACGIPVIAVDCLTGPREILDYDESSAIKGVVETEYGILCPAFQSDLSDEFGREMVLAEAIVRLLKDPAYHARYCVRSQLRAKLFSFEEYRKRLLEVVLPKQGE